MTHTHYCNYMYMHGCALNICNTGVLITGDSAIGKSELALQLLDRGHKFIADDVVVIKRIKNQEIKNQEINHQEVDNQEINPVIWNQSMLFMSAVESELPFLHIRGLGFVNVSKLYGISNIMLGCKLDLIINLANDANYYNANSSSEDCVLQQLISEVDILGIPILQMQLLINNQHRPLALLVETMVKYNNDKQLGYDSHQDFLNRHYAMIKFEK